MVKFLFDNGKQVVYHNLVGYVPRIGESVMSERILYTVCDVEHTLNEFNSGNNVIVKLERKE